MTRETFLTACAIACSGIGAALGIVAALGIGAALGVVILHALGRTL